MYKTIEKRLMADCFGERSIPVYGGAYHIALNHKEPSLQDIAQGALNAIESAKFWTPEVSAETVAMRFCSLFYVDHMLIEAMFGFRFSEVA